MTRQNKLHRLLVESQKFDKHYRKYNQNEFQYYVTHREEIRNMFQQMVDLGLYHASEWDKYKPKRSRRNEHHYYIRIH